MPRTLTAAIALLATTATAAPWTAGTTIQPLTLHDQHGAQRQLDDHTKLLVVTRDMDAGNLVKTALTDRPPTFLEEQSALYIADISRMPAVVTRLFALPSLRRRPYPILLDRDGKSTAEIPTKDKHATIITLDNLKVVTVDHISTPDKLVEALVRHQ
ncbi:MAG TPA: FAD/FMN-containing dehydrogenase [Candidatus Binatia bacterium]|nr:FAD/FMN-containing dehydrogenase [Candidatus Binatia bacterium]